MKRRLIAIFATLFFFQFISCNEELVVDQKDISNSTGELSLYKEGDLQSTLQDSILLKEKKAKVLRLKQEHEKPYVVIEKPEKLLAEKLNSRTPNKSISQPSKNSKVNLVQGTQSCYTLEIDVWALEKYHPISGLVVGICPTGSINYPQLKFWQYNRNILTALKSKYGFSKINLEPMAIEENNNVVYLANEIMAGISFDYTAVTTHFSNYHLGTLWAAYIDEPMHKASNVSECRQVLTNLKTWWKNNIGSSSLFIGGETTKNLAHEFDDIVDCINSTYYTDYQYLTPYFLCGLCYIPTEDDQRDVWTDFNSSFGNKFNHLWISATSDRGEMDQLIGHAHNMGKNGVWLWAGDFGLTDQSCWDAINEFCYFAFTSSYLRREERRFIYVYNYIGNDDPCYDYQITSWDLIDIIETSESRIL